MRMGIFRHASVGLTVSRPCSCGRSLRERGRIDAEAFSRRGGEPSMAWQACRVGYSADSGSARAVREVYLNPLISPSLPSFRSPVVQPAASRELLDSCQPFPRARDGHFCLHTTVYLQANSSALSKHSNPSQTCPGTNQHPQQAPAH